VYITELGGEIEEKNKVLEAHELAGWSMDLKSRCEWRPPEIL
jgi:hypothetical protein